MLWPMSTTDLDTVAVVFAALGHPGRLAILRALLRAHPQGLVVSEVQELVSMPGSTLSHHLDALRHAGVVESTREAQRIRYRARVANLRAVAEFLSTQCCANDEGAEPEAPAPRSPGGQSRRASR